ncbi:hypothetical protein QLH32_05165 [Acinetobacter corruptisaponis]|uniref:Uncharacterized protein n=1 Tax=Acinetobacter corruptisaponis TaxID=3045147 RepID=A0ABY8S819_9GAMM|nr:hypothetical protein [Acinetobacter sp. KCTC 92772]WHP06863.1 hypothetical protein QLH32_05165 [Acinetobacter sp. KCTC 92772]
MNAINFIKQHGIDKAREVVATYHKIPNYTFKEKTERGYSSCKSVDLSDLKRLVESVDFINKFGGIGLAKAYDKEMGSHGFDPFFEKSIADYESIYCVADMGDDTHIENHVSPLCKVGVK